MNSRAEVLSVALRVLAGERVRTADLAARVGTRATAKRALSWLRDQGVQLYPGARVEGYALRFSVPVYERQRRALELALAYESGDLSGLVRLLESGSQLELSGLTDDAA